MDASLGQAGLEGRSASGGCRPSFKDAHTDGTEAIPPNHRGETANHLELKRLALLWAQENRYPIAAFEVADITQEYARLSERGVAFTQQPTPAGPVTLAVLADTCGNLIQLYQRS